MLEESLMDKKQTSNRSSQPQSRGFTIDSKKSQDPFNAKPQKNYRRREPTNGTYSKQETIHSGQSRKPTPQRSKNVYDKRPKPRGGNLECMEDEDEASGLMDSAFSAEIGSVFHKGSKKQNLNHLLNFQFTPRNNVSRLIGDQNWRKGYQRNQGVHKHKYNKEQFLQANCQFVVTNKGRYDAYIKDADALVNWDLIEQVNIQNSECVYCPICLYPPTAGKITRCGHIYCWPCLLHYLALSDKSWRKCPICFESIHKKDLKSALIKTLPHYGVGDSITLKLMCRTKGEVQVSPVNNNHLQLTKKLLNVSENETKFSKLLLADKNQVNDIINRERDELERLLHEDENCPEKCFIEQALNELNLRFQINNVETNKTLETENEKDEMEIKIEGKSINNNNADQISDGPIEKFFYFYQAIDGQHIYLHPLNIHMLEHVYGSLDKCPHEITGVILEKECETMCEELRKRFRYMQHIPLTCQFEIAELDLKPPLVQEETLMFFKDQIETREQKRQRRIHEEQKHEKRVKAKEQALLRGNKIITYDEINVDEKDVNIQIESFNQFPTVEYSVALESSSPPKHNKSNSSEFTNLFGGTSSKLISKNQRDYPSFLKDQPRIEQPSFAKMLSQNSNSGTPKWVKTTPNRTDSIPIHPHHSLSSSRSQRKDSDISDDLLNEYSSPSSFNDHSFSDAIAIALERTNLNGNNNGGGKKKKKNQRKILFGISSMAHIE